MFDKRSFEAWIEIVNRNLSFPELLLLIVFEWEIGIGIYGRNTIAISEYLVLHIVSSPQFPCCLVSSCFFSVLCTVLWHSRAVACGMRTATTTSLPLERL